VNQTVIVTALTSDLGHAPKPAQQGPIAAVCQRFGETFLMVAIRSLYWTESIRRIYCL
jgi:hypothetical protein